ncbi:MAG: hypothetical protein JWP78_2351 [Mucilaginibacter sp.]|nr:hypothetical protein [Mucilaginibacter sp.]
MCGIAGIIDQPGQIITDFELKKMTDAVAHRGPDGEGFYVDKNLGFGHRRLSIIDLSQAGDQPMKLDEDYVITFNGEIYNYIELKDELKKLGHQFNTQTDTEVILVAYREWGTACVEKFNGMWAFAIHDIKNDIVFCSRDRFGVKPFYYTLINGKFFFGSEIKQLIHLQSNWFVNKRVLMDFLVFSLVDHTDQTFFEGINVLLGSHNLIYSLKSNTFSINKYYSITKHQKINNLSDIDSIKVFKAGIEQAVKFRLRSDVKVGTCLSGGLDSSYIASLASDLYNHKDEQFSAITAQSLLKEEDESNYASKVVESCGLNWLVTKPTTEDFLASLDEVIYNQEEPFLGMAIYMQHFVMKKAKDAGIVVLLDGQGADEILLGYSRYIAAYFKSLPFTNLINNIIKAKDHFGISALTLLKYYLYFTSYSIRGKRNMWRFRHIKTQYIKYLGIDTVKKITAGYKDIDKLQQLEIFSTQLPSLLRYEDKNSMASSIEARLPFLDWNFVELALSINNSFKIRNGWSKFILRRAMQGGTLPDEITWRKKKLGFNAPTSIWFEGFTDVNSIINKSVILNKIYDGKIPNYTNEQIKWRLLNIAKWEKIYNIKIN